MRKLLPDCYWAETDNGSYVSHESVCVLNEYDEDVKILMTLYFEDRDPVEGLCVTVPARRTKHIRLDKEFADIIPRGVPYAMIIECGKDVAVQYTRVDTTQKELALMTAMV